MSSRSHALHLLGFSLLILLPRAGQSQTVTVSTRDLRLKKMNSVRDAGVRPHDG